MEGTSGGGGHGGKGGNFEEKPEKPSNKKFGWSYGYNQEEMTAEPDLLGGSTGEYWKRDRATTDAQTGRQTDRQTLKQIDSSMIDSKITQKGRDRQNHNK